MSVTAQSALSPLTPVGGESAFPFKSASDSGVIKHFTSTPSYGCSNGGLCVVGWDACVYSALVGNFTQTLQQYTVPGCTPVQTPWITVKGGATSGWAVYCPSKAPYSWVNGYPGSQGQTFQWWTDSQYVGTFAQPPGTNPAGRTRRRRSTSRFTTGRSTATTGYSSPRAAPSPTATRRRSPISRRIRMAMVPAPVQPGCPASASWKRHGCRGVRP